MLRMEEQTKGVDKVGRYGWQVADEPGKLVTLRKSEILIDDEYQRDVRVDDQKVLRIAARWSWIACGALIVGKRLDGRLYVIDGQHRLRAALKRSDIRDLPCVVFESTGSREEAEAFLRANRNRKPMTAMQAFKAMVSSGDKTALAVQQMVEKAGLKMAKGSSPGYFSAPGVLIEMMRANEMAARVSWDLAIRICRDRPVQKNILQALFYIERNLKDQSLSEKKWTERAVAVGYESIKDAMDRAAAFRGKRTDKYLAEGVINALNKGLRSNLIELN